MVFICSIISSIDGHYINHDLVNEWCLYNATKSFKRGLIPKPQNKLKMEYIESQEKRKRGEYTAPRLSRNMDFI